MPIRTRLAALAVLFLLAHLPFLPKTLEDVDSINFALGVRDFDVARHQPHPPGYPVFVALAKASTAAAKAAGVPGAEPRGLAIWSALAGAALIPLLFLFFRALAGERRAWWATLVVGCAPLFWFTALRPLSDTTGLAFALAAQALLAGVIAGRAGAGALAAGAFLATFAIGVRSQSFVLTLPLLLWALVLPGTAVPLRRRVVALAAALAGGLAWGVPLLITSGGLESYMAALGAQAGEDFSGVVILWTVRSARVAAQALVHTFLSPWGRSWLGAIVLAIAAVGALRLLWALVLPGTPVPLRGRVVALGAALAGGLAWGVPLLITSGGLESYTAALGAQAGEDFSGVVILWSVRSARTAAQALVYTFLSPWGRPWLGAIVLAIAAIGALRLLRAAPRAAVLLGVAFVPYAAFHLLFHEIVTVRYALPLLIPVAFLFVTALDTGMTGSARFVLPFAAAGLAATGVVQSARPSWIYARDGSPAFRAFADARAQPDGSGTGRLAIGMHAFARRTSEWLGSELGRRALTARHGIEWLAAVEELRQARGLLFVADPRRTDLALFDPRALRLVGSYGWGFAEPPFVGGARPGHANLFRIESPGWMLDRGWALTAEVSGVTERDGGGPHRRPSVAWIRSREAAPLVLLGGRHLGAAAEPPAEITVAIADRVVAQWTAAPGFFVKRLDLPAGALAAADSYVPLRVTSRAADGSGREVRVGLEQFDVQDDGIPMFAFEEGWQEPEYNPMTVGAWRWMSDRSVLWVRPIGRDVTLNLFGESPLRYFDGAPTLRVTIGEIEVSQFRPEGDFIQEIRLPAAALAAAGGRVAIDSDRHFVPGDRDGSPDRRRLAVRMFGVEVR